MSRWERVRYLATTGLRRRARDLVLGADGADRFLVREDLARRYLRGEGIELGAGMWPMRVPPQAKVRYVDRVPREQLITDYGSLFAEANLSPSSIPEPDVLDDAATLATFADASQDFVIANHVLEHLEDPIGALGNLVRVVRPGGTVFVSLPDARTSFDAPRERTTVEHLQRDHQVGPHTSRRAHYEEWARHIDGATGEDVATRADQYEQQDARHHFHVWELDGFLELLRNLDLPAELELGQRNDTEFVVVLRRT